MSAKIAALGFMALSTICLSLSAFFAKLVVDNLSEIVLLTLRLSIPAFLMFGWCLYRQIKLPNWLEFKVLARRSVFIALTQACFFISLSELSLIEVVVLFSTGPLFIPIIERVIYQIKLSPLVCGAIAISFLGVVIQSGVSHRIEMKWSLLMALCSGFFNACSQVAMYRSSRIGCQPIMVNGLTFMVATLLVLPLLYFVDTDLISKTHSDELKVFICLLLMGILSVGTQLFRTAAYRRVQTTTELAPIFYLNIVIASALQILFFNTQFSAYQVVGLSMISLSGILYGITLMYRIESR